MKRFTLDGNDALENFLSRTCDEIRDAIASPKVGLLLLGGGYGRGEGGVLVEGDRHLPYNDLEFYVFTRSGRERFDELAVEFSRKTGVDVEFHVMTLTKLARSQVSMFYYDLLMGHRRLLGDERLLDRCAHHRVAENIPISEAVRLLLNRCTGLLLARQRLGQGTLTSADKDFIARNIAKAQLACGDALLTMAQRYHWSCRERHQRLKELSVDKEIVRHHADGVEFKLHPRRCFAVSYDLRKQHAEVSAVAREVWRKLPQSRFGSPLRNCVVNLRTSRRISVKHPRTRMTEMLPALLWNTDSRATTDASAYLNLWQKNR